MEDALNEIKEQANQTLNKLVAGLGDNVPDEVTIDTARHQLKFLIDDAYKTGKLSAYDHIGSIADGEKLNLSHDLL